MKKTYTQRDIYTNETYIRTDAHIKGHTWRGTHTEGHIHGGGHTYGGDKYIKGHIHEGNIYMEGWTRKKSDTEGHTLWNIYMVRIYMRGGNKEDIHMQGCTYVQKGTLTERQKFRHRNAEETYTWKGRIPRGTYSRRDSKWGWISFDSEVDIFNSRW